MDFKKKFKNDLKKLKKTLKDKDEESLAQYIVTNMDDCFRSGPKLYGFKTQIMIVQNETCFLGDENCSENEITRIVSQDEENNSTTADNVNLDLQALNDLENSNYFQPRTLSNVPHFQYVTPDLNSLRKALFNKNHKMYKRSAIMDFDELYDQFLRRQTGEDFASDGPPECRLTATAAANCS